MPWVHLISSQSLNLGGRRGTTDDAATIPSILPCLPLPSRNLQTPFPSFPWCYLPISSSVFLSFLLLSLSLAELSSPCQRILRCGHTIWVSVSLPWLGDHHALQLHSGFCCEPPRSSHGLCRKCSEVSYSISSQGLGFGKAHIWPSLQNSVFVCNRVLNSLWNPLHLEYIYFRQMHARTHVNNRWPIGQLVNLRTCTHI